MINGGISSSVEAMSSQAKRLDAITANLANVSTPGYKRRTTAIQGFDVSRGAAKPQMQPAVISAVDFGQGPLQHTGETFDLGLSGEGFFVVEGPEGELLTRGGPFRLDENGTLQDENGFAVAWDGARARIEPSSTAVTVDGRGLVSQDGIQLGQLRLVDLPAKNQLEPVSGGYWKASPQLVQTPSDAVVHQGAVEGSNASAVDELIELVRVQRQFESAANLMTTLDRTYQRLNRGR